MRLGSRLRCKEICHYQRRCFTRSAPWRLAILPRSSERHSTSSLGLISRCKDGSAFYPRSDSTSLSARRHYSSSKRSELPDSVKKSGLLTLPSRSLLLVHGNDAATFLQGLTTANIPAKAPVVGRSRERSALPPAIYSAFLNAQGRLLQDVFIYPLSPTEPVLAEAIEADDKVEGDIAFLIELDESQTESLLKWLRRYKLRSKVKLRVVDQAKLRVYFSWDEQARSPDEDVLEAVEEAGAYLASDIRSPAFGARIIASPGFSMPQTATLSDYTLRRYLHSLPEGPSELPPGNSLVHDSSLDKAHAVDFRKGCYVGQELVIRTQHTGVVRKRIIPIALYPSSEEQPIGLVDSYRPVHVDLEPGTEIWREGEQGQTVEAEGSSRPKKPRAVGKFIANIGNVGLANVRLEPMVGVGPSGERVEGWTEGNFEVRPTEQTGNAWRVKAVLPWWW